MTRHLMLIIFESTADVANIEAGCQGLRYNIARLVGAQEAAVAANRLVMPNDNVLDIWIKE